MSDQAPEDTPPPKGHEHWDRWWTRAGVIIGAITALIALIAWLAPMSGPEDSTESDASTQDEFDDSQPQSDNARQPNPTEQSQEPPGSESSCFESGQRVSCAAAHSSELVQIDTCDLDSLTEYMGGDSARDVIIGNLSLDPQEDGCLVSEFDPEATVPIKDALKDQEGDAFRSCWDGSANAEVPCSVPHSAERVFRGSTGEIDCEQKYNEYVDRAYFRDKDDLALKLNAENGSSCWAETRGNDLLKGSIRNLGDRALPFSEPQD